MLGQGALPILLPSVLPLLQPLKPWAPLLLLMPLLRLPLLLPPDCNSCGACPLGGGGVALEFRHSQRRRRTGGAHWTG